MKYVSRGIKYVRRGSNYVKRTCGSHFPWMQRCVPCVVQDLLLAKFTGVVHKKIREQFLVFFGCLNGKNGKKTLQLVDLERKK